MAKRNSKRNSNSSKGIVVRGGGWYELPGGEKVRGRTGVMAALMADKPTKVGRLSFLRQAGLQFQGLRDIYTTAGYVEQGKESFDNYWSRYERDPVAGRIVDMLPKTTWRTPPEVFDEEQDKERKATKFEAAWEGLVTRLRVWRHFERVDRLSRVGRYAALLIGARGGDDKELKKPLERVKGPDDIIYLSSFAEKHAEIDKWDKDPGSPRFGLPNQYEVTFSSGVQAFGTGKAMVHHSRIIHVAEDTLTDDVYGRPALKRVLNALDDLLKVTASTGEAYWQLAARILAGKIDPDMQMNQAAVDAMGEAMEEMVHDLRRQFVGHGVELDWLGGEPPKPNEALELYKAIVAVGSGYPTRILFGSEMGQLASDQDERAYFGTVNERQEHHAEPDILRAFIDRLLGVGALPSPKDGEYKVVWPALFELTEKEMAEANLLRAEAAKTLTPMGGDPLDLVEIDEKRDVWLLSTEKLTAAAARTSVVEGDEDEGPEGE